MVTEDKTTNVARLDQVTKNRWTGMAGKTLWDWLQLLVIPIVLATIGFLFNIQQVQISETNSARQHVFDQQLALDQQREATLKAYLDDMTTLLLTDKLHESKQGDEVRSIARAQTLTALRQLDPSRKATLLEFLFQSDLITVPRDIPVNRLVDLSNADLSGIHLPGTELPEIDLAWTNLSGVDLSGANLNNAALYTTDLSMANLSHADLDGSDLSSANLRQANLTDAVLPGSYLKGADLSGATLTRANLRYANLTSVSMKGADLSFADLTGSNITVSQVDEASSVHGAILPVSVQG